MAAREKRVSAELASQILSSWRSDSSLSSCSVSESLGDSSAVYEEDLDDE